MNPTILIRADASSRIGTGHIMRCLTLANALRERGYRMLFLTRPLPGNIDHKIESSGFALRHILSDTREEEIREVNAVIEECTAFLIVFDHYGIDEAYEKQVQECSGITIFSFDDTFEKHRCDLLLNQNIYAHKEAYRGLVPQECMLLCGTEFALIRDEFKTIQKRHREAALPEEVRLLLTLGGADADNVTLEILKTLETMAAYRLRADVVIGAANPHAEALKAFALTSRHALSVHVNASNMSELMNRADIAISGAGSTTIELLCMSVPSLVLVLAENQRRIAEYMHSHRLALALDASASLDAGVLQGAVEELIENADLRATFLRNMQQHAIGDTDKLIKAIECSLHASYTLRPAAEADLMPLFELSNTAQVRANSLNSQPITLPEHTEWFDRRLKQTDSPFLIIENRGMFLGQVRLDKKEEGYIVSISLTDHLKGCGYAKAIVAKALETLPPHSIAVAYIKTSNAPSLAVFEHNGFKIVETTLINTVATHKLLKEITA